MKPVKSLKDLIKKLNRIQEEKQANDNEEEQDKEDRARYQTTKNEYTLHDESSYIPKTSNGTYVGNQCTYEGYVIECPYWPE